VTDNRWYSVLDDLDAHLGQQELAFEAGHAELIEAFVLPASLGAVPPNLQPRLDSVRRRSAALEAAVVTRRDEIGRRLGSLPRRRAEVRPVASYFDTSA
jgi:hypothetical protein